MGEQGPRFPGFPIHGIGRYEAAMVVSPMERALVASWLPDRLELGEQEVTPPGTHPVLYSFGYQRDVRANVLPPLRVSYHEFIAVVPYVRFKGQPYAYDGPYSFMPRLYLDQLGPTLLGWLYGYDKVLARVRGGEFYRVHTAGLDRPIIQAKWRPQGEEVPASELAGFDAIREIFELPLIGQWKLGPYVSSYLRFELGRAVARPASAVVDVRAPFLHGLEVGRAGHDPLAPGALGGLWMDVPWTLTAPAWPSQVEPT